MLTIRPATIADAPELAALIRQSFQKQAEALAIDPDAHPNYVAFDTDAGVRRRIESGVHVLLGYRGDELVGTVSWRRRQGGTGEITRLAVLPAHRGRQYGRTLMARAEQELVAAGAALVELSIVAQFRRLQTYYEELGYGVRERKRVASLPFELLVMEKRLADGASVAPRAAPDAAGPVESGPQ